MVDSNGLSIDQVFSLLRLYLDWPDYFDESQDQEANEFYLWLAKELEEAELADVTGGLDGVKQFIRTNPEVLARARHLKRQTINGATQADYRQDTRIPVHTQTFFLVYDCPENPSLEGSIVHGVLVDIARQGMRVESNTPVPAGSIISMTVAQTGTGVTLYNLTCEVRWFAAHSESYHLGISIFNIEEYEKWQEFYYVMSSSY